MVSKPTFGDLIRQARRNAQFRSAEEAEAAVNIHHDTLYNYESDKSLPPIESAISMSVGYQAPYLFAAYLREVFKQCGINLFDFEYQDSSQLILKVVKETSEANAQNGQLISVACDGVEKREVPAFVQVANEYADVIGPALCLSIEKSIYEKTAFATAIA